MSVQGSILVIDDDEGVLYTAKMVLKPHFEEVYTQDTPQGLEALLGEKRFDVIILDMNFSAGLTSGKEGLRIMQTILAQDPEAHIVVNTAYGDVDLAVAAMKLGAVDFIVKPWPKEKLLAAAQAAYRLGKAQKEVQQLKGERRVLQEQVEKQYPDIITQSAVMHKVLETLEKVAQTDANVLILGENGTGKELIARALHRQSTRSAKAFVKTDVGAIPESLFESELFGHTKGAFTDAKTDRAGRFELASQGTLFLDEIGNLALALQAKLLSALQNRQVYKVGSSRPTPVDIRLVAATNQDLYGMVSEGLFRQDLLYRINTVELIIPPLRQRAEDIPLLIHHFLQLYAEKYNKAALRLRTHTLKKLQSYDWPGNVRELQHATERAVIMSSGEDLSAEDFMPAQRITVAKGASFKVEDLEKDAIQKAISKWEGNLSKAAKELGMGRSTLYRKIERYGL